MIAMPKTRTSRPAPSKPHTASPRKTGAGGARSTVKSPPKGVKKAAKIVTQAHKKAFRELKRH